MPIIDLMKRLFGMESAPRDGAEAREAILPEEVPVPQEAPRPREPDGRREAPSGRFGRVRVGLVTIIDEEFAETQKVFGLGTQIPGTGYFVACGGEGFWDVALVQATDRSNVPIVTDVSNFMEDLRPQVLILVGIAGGMCTNGRGRDGIAPGDVVIADQVRYVEFLKIADSEKRMRSYAIDHPSVPLRRNVAMPLSKLFKVSENVVSSSPAACASKVHIGEIVSSEKVMGDAEDPVQVELLAPFEKAIAVDMESIGMARAVCEGRSSFWYHPRYAIIRGISDLVAAEENDEQRAEWKPFAAHVAAVVAKEYVRMLPEDPQP